MKKLLLTLSLIAGFASISAANTADDLAASQLNPTDPAALRVPGADADTSTPGAATHDPAADSGSGSDRTPSASRFESFKKVYNACTLDNAKALPRNTFAVATATRPRIGVSAVVVTGLLYVAAKKAYDRYKVWKNTKAENEEVAA